VIRTRFPARRGATALFVAACAAALAVPASAAPAAEVTVNPNSGAPGSQFTINLKNYHACAPDSPNCIVIDFVQSGRATRIGTADSHGSSSFTGTVSVPPAAAAGAATIHAFSTTDDATTPFTVTGAPAPTTTTAGPGTTTTSSSTSTTTTTVAVTTTVSTVVLSPTTTAVPIPVKKSSHSDVPRYIAVALVVLAAAATAAVDTRQRRLRGPGGTP
jgi:hypothetical protein